ncbi:MAG: hypothetical protein EBY29_10125, partial [Planctomycetes bacterium]|nr:hypothetical protein [Planctomycetota bacterium]
ILQPEDAPLQHQQQQGAAAPEPLVDILQPGSSLLRCPLATCAKIAQRCAQIAKHVGQVHAALAATGALDDKLRARRIVRCGGGCKGIGLLTGTGFLHASHQATCTRQPASKARFDADGKRLGHLLPNGQFVHEQPGQQDGEHLGEDADGAGDLMPARVKKAVDLILRTAHLARADASEANHDLTTAATELLCLRIADKHVKSRVSTPPDADPLKAALTTAAAAANDGDTRRAAQVLDSGRAGLSLADPGVRAKLALQFASNPHADGHEGTRARLGHLHAAILWPDAPLGPELAHPDCVAVKPYTATEVERYFADLNVTKGAEGTAHSDWQLVARTGGIATCAAIATLVTLSATDSISNSALAAIFRAERNTAIPKADGGPRCITMGTALARCRDVLVERRSKSYYDERMAANMAAGVPGGCEAAAMAAQAAYDAGRVILLMDAQNAYYQISQEHLAAVHADAPELLLYMRAALGHKRTALFDEGADTELRLDIRDGIAAGSAMSMAMFGLGFECIPAAARAALQPTGGCALNISDGLVAIGGSASTAADFAQTIASVLAAAGPTRLVFKPSKSTLLCKDAATAALLAAALDQQPDLHRPTITTEGELVGGVPVGTEAYRKAVAQAACARAALVAARAEDATLPGRAHGPPMTRQAALSILRTHVLPRVVFLARALGYRAREALGAFDAEVAARIRRLSGDSGAPSGPEEELLESLTSEKRKHGGCGFGSVASIVDAGHVASVATSSAQLMKRLGEALSLAPHPTKLCVLHAEEHEAACLRLIAGGVPGVKLDKLRLTTQLIIEVGAAGTGTGKQATLAGHLGRQRCKERAEAAQGMDPQVRYRLTAGAGGGTAVLHASRRDPRNRLADTLLTEVWGAFKLRAAPESTDCPHCPEVLDKLGTHNLGCKSGGHGWRCLAHNRMRDAIVQALGGRGLETRATAEPWLKDHPDVFGLPLTAAAGLKRADVLVTDSDGGKSFFDVTVAWDARIHAAQELENPGRAEGRAEDRKRGEYNAAYAGAGVKVGTLCANPYGDFLGASKDALREVVRRRASELSVASQTSEIKTYNTMISGLRMRLSLAFWRPTAVARI